MALLSEDLYRLIPKLIKSMAKISKISSENVYIRTALVDGVLYTTLQRLVGSGPGGDYCGRR